MEYVNVDVSYDSNVNYVGSNLRRPGNLLFTDYDGVWTVNKSSNRGNKMSVHRIAVIEPVSYVFSVFFLVRSRFNSNRYIILSGPHVVFKSRTPQGNLTSGIDINLLSCCFSHLLLLDKTAVCSHQILFQPVLCQHG